MDKEKKRIEVMMIIPSKSGITNERSEAQRNNSERSERVWQYNLDAEHFSEAIAYE